MDLMEFMQAWTHWASIHACRQLIWLADYPQCDSL